jgi:hypothetical protein
MKRKDITSDNIFELIELRLKKIERLGRELAILECDLKMLSDALDETECCSGDVFPLQKS